MARSPEADLLVQIVTDPDEPDQRVSVIGDQVITATPADEGKVVTVEADGTLGLEDAAGGGWPLTADVSAAGFDIADVGTLTLMERAPIRGTSSTPHMGSDGHVIDGDAGDSNAFEVFSGDQTKVGDWAVVAAMPYSYPGSPSAELDVAAKGGAVVLYASPSEASIYFDTPVLTGRSLALGAAGLYIDGEKIATAADLAALIAANDVARLAGVLDASGNPNYPAANAGDVYRISVAGKIGGASGITVAAGDLAMCLVDGTAAGTNAAVGGSWSVIKTDMGPLATVATTGAYSDLTGKPTLGTAAALDSGTGAGNLPTTTQADARYAKLVPRIGTTASSATPTPDADAHDQYNVTALAAGATFGAPAGTPTDGQKLVIRVKDNGTARALAFNAAYRAIGVTLPATTVVSKLLYLGMRYNAADSKWDVLSVAQEA